MSAGFPGGGLAAWIVAIAATALALLLGGGMALQRCQLAEAGATRAACEHQARQLESEAGATRAQLAAYRGQVDEQNRQVEALRAEAEALLERVETAERRIGETRIEYRDRVRRVLVTPVPSDCEAAVRWGAQQARAAAQVWREGG